MEITARDLTKVALKTEQGSDDGSSLVEGSDDDGNSPISSILLVQFGIDEGSEDRIKAGWR